jgi:hypothetical protein
MGWQDAPLAEPQASPAAAKAPKVPSWQEAPLAEGQPFPAPGAQPVPEWAVRNPELYGLAGAAKEALGPVVTGLMGAGGAIAGTVMGGPVGGVVGGGGGYAAGEELNYLAEQALGLRGPREGAEQFTAPLYNLGLGAAFETGAGLAASGLSKLGGIIRPRMVALNALLGVGGEQLPQQIRAGAQAPGTPGVSRTLTEEVLAGGGRPSPSLATLERRLPATSQEANELAFRINETRRNALQDQLQRVEQFIQTQAANLAPQQAAQLRTVRDNLMQRLSQAESELVSQQNALAQANMPQGGLRPGERLAKRAQGIKQTVRQQEIQPAYAKAFAAAKDARIDVSPVVADAEAILGRTLSDFAPETAPNTVRALAALRPAPTTTVIRQPGMPPIPQTTQAQPVATLEQLDDIRRAINADIQAARTGAATSSLDATTLRQLGQLHRSIDDTIKNAPDLPGEAKNLYAEAVAKYRTEFAPRFKVGLPAKMLTPTRYGEAAVLPDRIVETMLNARERGVGQILRLYGGDKGAMTQLRGGLEDLFRSKVVNPVDMRVDTNAAKAFLTKYDAQLKQLDDAGLNVKAGLDNVLKEAQQIERGLTKIQGLAGTMKGPSNADELIDTLLANSDRMGQAVKTLDADGRVALSDALRRRFVDRINANDADGALKLLQSKGDTFKLGMGRNAEAARAYESMVDTAKWLKQAQEVSKQAGEPVQRQAVTLLKQYSPEDLTNLQSAMDDIQRMRTVTKLAGEGAATPSPVAGRLATEDLQRMGLSAAEIPNPLMAPVTIAKGVWARLEQRVNRKAASILADFMYRNPQGAADAIEAELARRGRWYKKPAVGRAARFTGLSEAQQQLSE